MPDPRPPIPAAAPLSPRVHVVIPTHTTRHLAACLCSMAWQARAPETVVVTCDTDDSSIGSLLESWWPRIAAACRGGRPRLIHASRPHQGEPRLNQTRNNGLRALDRIVRPGNDDLVVVLDGDTLLSADAIQRHFDYLTMGFGLIIPYRINLDEATSAGLEADQLLGQVSRRIDPVAGLASDDDRASLAMRHRRYLRHLLLRRSIVPGVPKRHKPKILGGHHAISVRHLRAVNGYDEQYVGYGYDDDDIARRLHTLSPPPRTAIAVAEIFAFHLWHRSRAPARPTDAPGFARFSRPDLPVAAEHGWKNPASQPDPVYREVSPFSAVAPASA